MSPAYIHKLIELLENIYPEAVCSLDYDTDWRLLFATRLAAQCTDERVNMKIRSLFKLSSLESLAAADLTDVRR
jgi:endonuclease-3